jgi:hypothetical protein
MYVDAQPSSLSLLSLSLSSSMLTLLLLLLLFLLSSFFLLLVLLLLLLVAAEAGDAARRDNDLPSELSDELALGLPTMFQNINHNCILHCDYGGVWCV